MNTPQDSDHAFDDNLSRIGARANAPQGASAELRERCAVALRGEIAPAAARRRRWLRRPAFLSTVGVAAAIAMAFGFFYRPTADARVEAAVILETLTTQIQQDPLLKIKLESLQADGARIDGELQVSRTCVAGDLRVEINQGGEHVEVDLSLGISQDDGWILIRKLVVSDEQAQPILNFFFPPGSETLIKLPKDELDLKLGDLDADLAEIGSGKIAELVREMIDSASDVGATVTQQADGTMLLILPIKDASTIQALVQLESLTGSKRELDENARQALRDLADEIDDDDVKDLVGATISVIYDPGNKQVRSLAIENVGGLAGRIELSFGEGDIDPQLLDSSRVTNENTRVFDLDALQNMMEGFGKKRRGRRGGNSDDG